FPSGVETTKRGGYAYVVAILRGSPAALAGVQVGDYIRSINGESTREMSVFQVRRALTGRPGTMLKLNLFGDGEGRVVEMTLTSFQPSPLTLSGRQGGVFLIKVHYLGPDTLQALERALSAPPKGTRQVLLDLRNTVGGGRQEGIALADLFLSEGTIVKVDERGQEEVIVEATPAESWDGPLAVLANGLSAGSVEIAIAALKENERGRILGERTFGDASMQKMIRLPDSSAVILSVGRYLSPGGESWSGSGVEPDVEIASRDSESQAEEDREDGQLRRALEYLVKDASALKPAA
ncbi:MAG: S41 family peptidase, partial [Acidobacteriota bacterium]